MYKTKWITAFVLASCLTSFARAQDADVTITRNLTVSVKPGMNAQFEEFVKAYRDASKKQGLKNYWRAAQSVSGDAIYQFIAPMSSWGDLTNPGPELAKAYGEKEAMRLNGLLSDSVASMHTAFYEQHASMSHIPAKLEKAPEGLIFYDFTLNPGSGPQFMELATKSAQASMALTPNSYFAAAMPSFGASGPRTIILLQSMKDLDKPQPGIAQQVVQHFGKEEGARLNALASKAIANIAVTLYRTRPDLSYQPAE